MFVTVKYFFLWLFGEFSQESCVEEIGGLFVLIFIYHYSCNNFEECLSFASELSHHLTCALLAKATIHARLFLSDKISQSYFFGFTVIFSVEYDLVLKKIHPLVRDILSQLLVRILFKSISLSSLRAFNL